MNGKLTVEDVEKLLDDPSDDTRVETATKVAQAFANQKLGESEQKIANDIFEIMARDAAERVRVALSENLRECPQVLRGLARTLANDTDPVAVPMITGSGVLTDEDLVEIVRKSGETKQIAVANRPRVSEMVTDSLVAHGTEKVVVTVMQNPGAEISESTYGAALDKFPGSDSVGAAIHQRSSLPIAVAERLVAWASDNLRDELATAGGISNSDLSDLMMRVRERATLSLIDPNLGGSDAAELVRTLSLQGRLSSTIIIRALIMGDISFFEAAMSQLTGLPEINTRVLIRDKGRRGLKAVWEKASMPAALFPVMAAAVEVADQMGYDGQPDRQALYCRQVVDRLTQQFKDEDLAFLGLDADNLEYLLTRLNEYSGGALAASF